MLPPNVSTTVIEIEPGIFLRPSGLFAYRLEDQNLGEEVDLLMEFQRTDAGGKAALIIVTLPWQWNSGKRITGDEIHRLVELIDSGFLTKGFSATWHFVDPSQGPVDIPAYFFDIPRSEFGRTLNEGFKSETMSDDERLELYDMMRARYWAEVDGGSS